MVNSPRTEFEDDGEALKVIEQSPYLNCLFVPGMTGLCIYELVPAVPKNNLTFVKRTQSVSYAMAYLIDEWDYDFINISEQKRINLLPECKYVLRQWKLYKMYLDKQRNHSTI